MQRVIAMLVTFLLSACALLGKSDPLVPKYYSPESHATPVQATPAASAQYLRLGRIQGDALRERIVYRDSPYELGYYEDRRWTERPEAYLRRALSRALFEERGFLRVTSGVSAILEAEIVAFEEIRKPKPLVRMQVVVTLDRDHVTILHETIRVERPIAASKDHTAAVVEALSQALQATVTQIAERVTSKLSAPPEPSPAAEPSVPAEPQP